MRRSASRCKSFYKYSSSNISLFSSLSLSLALLFALILLELVNSCMPGSQRIHRRNYERDENVRRALRCERVSALLSSLVSPLSFHRVRVSCAYFAIPPIRKLEFPSTIRFIIWMSAAGNNKFLLVLGSTKAEKTVPRT